MSLDTFHHERAIRHGSAGAKRWPPVRDVRATTPEGLRRWRCVAGPYRTRRAAMRAARSLRDASGIRYAYDPEADLYGVTQRERGAWYVLSRPCRRKPEEPVRFVDVLPEVPF